MEKNKYKIKKKNVSLTFVPSFWHRASKTLGIGVIGVFLCYATEATWLGDTYTAPGCRADHQKDQPDD